LFGRPREKIQELVSSYFKRPLQHPISCGYYFVEEISGESIFPAFLVGGGEKVTVKFSQSLLTAGENYFFWFLPRPFGSDEGKFRRPLKNGSQGVYDLGGACSVDSCIHRLGISTSAWARFLWGSRTAGDFNNDDLGMLVQFFSTPRI
jgi:hypothetical protein